MEARTSVRSHVKDVLLPEFWTTGFVSPDFHQESKESTVELAHPFSEPWEDSDLVLAAEDEKFHVHRQILSIHSPVFKAMLGTKFKEATAKEIPLPGKNADEVLDFLKQLYLKESNGVTCKGKISKFTHN